MAERFTHSLKNLAISEAELAGGEPAERTTFIGTSVGDSQLLTAYRTPRALLLLARTYIPIDRHTYTQTNAHRQTH